MMLAAQGYLARGAWVYLRKPSCTPAEFGRIYSADCYPDVDVVTETVFGYATLRAVGTRVCIEICIFRTGIGIPTRPGRYSRVKYEDR